MFRNFKFRLFPNRNQLRELAVTLETHRRLYNQALDERIFCWETTGSSLDYFFQSGRFTIIRSTNRYYARINATSGHLTLKRLDKAYASFFRRLKSGAKSGFPRFKSKEQFNSWTYGLPNGGGAKLANGKLRLQGIGSIRINMHRELCGRIKTIQIVREVDKWFAVFCCDIQHEVAVSDKPAVGIDVGIESFFTTSDGDHEPSPQYLKKSLPALRLADRSLCRKKKGGSNRRKAVKKLRKIHNRVRNLRREHHHQVSQKLIRRYGFIAVERLSVSSMVKNSRMSRSIVDAGWASFIGILKCKAEYAGVQVVEVDPKGTSQTCVCGASVRKELSVRWHDCPECGLSLHRDHVSAKIILVRGLVRTVPAGANVAGCRKRSPRSHLVKQAK